MLNTKNLYVASFWSVPYAAGAGRRGSGGRHGGELRRKEKAEKAKAEAEKPKTLMGLSAAKAD